MTTRAAERRPLLDWLDLGEGPVEAPDGLFFVDLEAEGQLRAQGEAGAGKHPLQGGADPLGLLGEREIAHHFGDLEDVPRRHLLVEDLVPAAPVGAGLFGLALFIVFVIALAAGVTWLTVKVFPASDATKEQPGKSS